MGSLLPAMSRLLPFLFAFADEATKSSNMQNVVSWIAGIGGGIVAICLIISLIKDGLGYAKGSGDSSVFKIVGKVIFLIVIIGLIYAAVNYDDLGKKGQTIANEGVNIANEEINNALK
jgi:hypothetical protein